MQHEGAFKFIAEQDLNGLRGPGSGQLDYLKSHSGSIWLCLSLKPLPFLDLDSQPAGRLYSVIIGGWPRSLLPNLATSFDTRWV